MAAGKGQAISAPENAHRRAQPAAEPPWSPKTEHLRIADVVHRQNVCSPTSMQDLAPCFDSYSEAHIPVVHLQTEAQKKPSCRTFLQQNVCVREFPLHSAAVVKHLTSTSLDGNAHKALAL